MLDAEGIESINITHFINRQCSAVILRKGEKNESEVCNSEECSFASWSLQGCSLTSGRTQEFERNLQGCSKSGTKGFIPVQNILDKNRLLINEINQNQESKVPDNLTRNVGMIRELNNNIGRVVDLYAGLSSTFVKDIETSSEGDSAGTSSSDRNAGVASGQKRNRPT
ncbi:hypothetical protein SUGI_0406040 [Cryptomeria japonica]|nr:hypothetical protein SUGI_0406040 [Cryptomeria japonica]